MCSLGRQCLVLCFEEGVDGSEEDGAGREADDCPQRRVVRRHDADLRQCALAGPELLQERHQETLHRSMMMSDDAMQNIM